MSDATTDQALCCRKKLGEILVERHVITPEQIDEALAAQKESYAPFGEILVRRGAADEIDIIVALIIQCNIPYLALHNYPVNPEAVRLVPGDVARRYRLVPFEKVGDVLSVVMADPLDHEAVEHIKSITGLRVAPFIATGKDIAEALDRVYAASNPS